MTRFYTRDAVVVWKQEDIVNRFRGVNQDMIDMMQTRIMLADSYGPELRDAYLDGIEDATTELCFILTNRFNEITRVLEKEKGR